VKRTIVARLTPMVLVACGGGGELRPEPPDARAWVTGEAAASLDERGRFRFPPARPRVDGPTITEADAARLATARMQGFTSYKEFPRNFRGERLSLYERDRGDLIDFKALRAGPRVYLAESPYEPVPGTWPEHVLEVLEPRYLVPLYSAEGFETLVVSVPARDMRYAVDADGQIRAGPSGSLRLTTTALPAGAEYDVPLSPECAVRVVAEATGRRVVNVPELVQGGRPEHPVLARWRLVLDAPVSLRGDSTKRVDTTRVIYVRSEWRRWLRPSGIDPTWYRALPDQRGADTLQSWTHTDPQRYSPGQPQLHVARIRAGYPVRFERVRPPENAAARPTNDLFPCELRPRAANSRWAGFGR
jgi:hypothetical protein